MNRSRTLVAWAIALLLALASGGFPALAQQNRDSSALEREYSGREYLGFDRNDYPGDQALPALRRHFDFVGYWLTNPPGERQNSWAGKRSLLLAQGFGFLVLANGRTDAEIKSARKSPSALGKGDAAVAVAAAAREHFPPGTVLFLDQEEGGRLLPEQAAYLLAWTEAVAASSYRAGAYVSGQPVNEGAGQTITTARNIQQLVTSQNLKPVVLWVYQDACPPSNGCTLHPPPLAASGTPGAEIWQYAQSPRRRSLTAACAKTYASDDNCYLNEPALSGMHLDLSVAAASDPSHGR